jgi:2,3-bisphosphoglycerate-independent phosphoglycerate mutase
MQTLYADLPRGSIVAQLGMLGWDPHRYCPGGRSSCELLALGGVALADGDLAFRANLVRMEGRRLASYNAHYILSEQAQSLVEKVRAATHDEFPRFELYHNSDFRNTLVVRRLAVDPNLLACPEPHESEGLEFEVERLVRGGDRRSQAVAELINAYLVAVARILAAEPANMLFPWSASRALALPTFAEATGFEGRAAVVGSMDFLQGIALAGGLEFFKVGNGRPDTDYAAKGRMARELLASGRDFVVCHINGPDEASHMGDLELKIRCIERIDAHVVGPIVEFFRERPAELGAVMVVPDHYTNYTAAGRHGERSDAHSLDPVPFALWNGRDRDEARAFSEDGVLAGRHGADPVSHLQLLHLLGMAPAACEKAVG